MTLIEWRPVPLPGYEDLYQVSNTGLVKRIAPNQPGRPINQPLKPWINHGYEWVSLYDKNSKRRKIKVHRLVAKAFHGPPPPGHITRHLDGDRRNNHADNLSWGTHSENMQDMVRHGRQYNQYRDRTHCANGHEFTEENTLIAKDGRKCRLCRRDRVRRWRARQKAKAAK